MRVVTIGPVIVFLQFVAAQSIPAPTLEGCVSHLDHFDCADSSFCELNATGNGWLCILADGSKVDGNGLPLAETAQDDSTEPSNGHSTCVVHGGHTHGDCSGKCGSIDTGKYDLPLHIGSVFIVLASSSLGVALPILTVSWASLPVLKEAFFAARYFGTGVIIATALVHLLYHAFVMFNNSCLVERLAFEPTAALISIGAIYVVFIVDLFSLRYIRGLRAANGVKEKSSESSGTIQQELPYSHGGHVHGTDSIDHLQARTELWLLEAGIIFHSVMIGVMLGATGGTPWVPLLCAIVFHQSTLCPWLADCLLKFDEGKGYEKWLMALAFALITPVGIAIGVGVHNSYNPNSDAALLSIGVLDAISAGILLYSGLVELLAHDFMDGDLKTASAGRVWIAITWVFVGTTLMSFLGKWA
ncbi:Zip-domain-containing protein [Auriculariales sp. MPI-PUGE-AT-0066]|nr:Zip-domain-containing protein [Auriculariales sp. MPI-PUGE-AT-0066]